MPSPQNAADVALLCSGTPGGDASFRCCSGHCDVNNLGALQAAGGQGGRLAGLRRARPAAPVPPRRLVRRPQLPHHLAQRRSGDFYLYMYSSTCITISSINIFTGAAQAGDGAAGRVVAARLFARGAGAATYGGGVPTLRLVVDRAFPFRSGFPT